MRIAFDLDDTLIPGEFDFPTEPAPFGLLASMFEVEPLRLGTVHLFRELRQRGHEIFIYTSSLRGPWTTKMCFYAYGTRIKKVINEDIHRRRMARLGNAYKTCIKYPPAFNIDVLIDNSEYVEMESRIFNYEMIHVRPDDPDWVERIWNCLGLD